MGGDNVEMRFPFPVASEGPMLAWPDWWKRYQEQTLEWRWAQLWQMFSLALTHDLAHSQRGESPCPEGEELRWVSAWAAADQLTENMNDKVEPPECVVQASVLQASMALVCLADMQRGGAPAPHAH